VLKIVNGLPPIIKLLRRAKKKRWPMRTNNFVNIKRLHFGQMKEKLSNMKSFCLNQTHTVLLNKLFSSWGVLSRTYQQITDFFKKELVFPFTIFSFLCFQRERIFQMERGSFACKRSSSKVLGEKSKMASRVFRYHSSSIHNRVLL